MLADKTNLFMSSKSLSELVNKLNTELEKLTQTTGLKQTNFMNLNKTSCILFSSKGRE